MRRQKKTNKASSGKNGQRQPNGKGKPNRAATGKNWTGLTMADACAGLGAFRLASESLGVRCVWSCEIDRHAARVYQANFGDDPTGDLTAVRARDVPHHDILCIGLPCQSFSLQGRRRGTADPRGRLSAEALRILLHGRPNAFVAENVENFRHIDGGRAFANLKAHLERLGYAVHDAVLDARNFGVPQSRRRLFIVGIHHSAGAGEFRFPEGGPPATNLREILEPDGDVPQRFDFSDAYRAMLMRAKDLNLAKGSNHGFMLAKRTHFNAIVRSSSGTEKNVIIRPDGTWRRPTPLECQRAQGFPDGYDLSSVSVTRRYNLLGNSVAVPVVRAVVERLVAALTGKSPAHAQAAGRARKSNPIKKTTAAIASGAPIQECPANGNGGMPPSPLAWYGSKGRLAPAIVRLFPPHQTYIEPFVGGGSVFFAKPPSPVEVVNDMHGDLVNFFRVLRDKHQCDRLVDLVEGTPWSREEFCDALVARKAGRWKDDAERAWLFLVATRQALNGVGRRPSDWSYAVGKTTGGVSGRTSMWMRLPQRLAVAGLRLKAAQIELGPWQAVLDRYESENTLAYCDPPYLHATRRRQNRDSYDHEMTDADHARLLLRLKQFKGKVVLSGYASSLYDELLSGWRRIEIETTSSASNRTDKKRTRRTEVLWLNYTPPAADAA